MKSIVTINPGSSSIKIGLFHYSQNTVVPVKREIFTGAMFDPQYLETVLKQWITTPIDAIGVRVVHGGNKGKTPTIITPEILTYLESIQSLAPLHNPQGIACIKVFSALFPDIPIVAVFDTSFHALMPEKAKRYAVPEIWYERHGVARYGFHGLAHQSMLKLYGEEVKKMQKEISIITVQLGSGCSICAIKNGVSVDTSMGFSPLEGLISRTRSGDIDPTVIPYMSHCLHITEKEVVQMLNTEAGLSGVSNSDGDIRTILANIDREDKSSVLSLELFYYRIQKYLGAYDTILQGSDAVILGGGISEHVPQIWAGIFSLPYFGVSVDTNQKIAPPITKISTGFSKRPAYVATVDEEREIAWSLIDTAALSMKE